MTRKHISWRFPPNIDGLVQERRNSSVLAMSGNQTFWTNENIFFIISTWQWSVSGSGITNWCRGYFWSPLRLLFPHYLIFYFHDFYICVLSIPITTLIARFMGPTWGPPGADRAQVGPMLAPWTLLSGQEAYDFYMELPAYVKYKTFINLVRQGKSEIIHQDGRRLIGTGILIINLRRWSDRLRVYHGDSYTHKTVSF